MNNSTQNSYANLLASILIFCAALVFSPGPAGSAAAEPASSAASPEALRLGERIYREGILSSGDLLRASVKEGLSVPGTTFACASCHLRSGLGALEENVYIPPINGQKLFNPLPNLYKGFEQSGLSLPPLRPAYGEESLIRVLRSGVDPNGRLLSEAMPRYLIEERDARLLVDYLKSLSSRFSPGVSDTTIRFATVISEDADPVKSGAMLASFDNFVKMQNSQIRSFRNQQGGAKARLMAENMFASRELATRIISISHWKLKGPAETWRSQLEEYNRKEPVFALLGGIVSGPWKPVHEFCEQNMIPCLFPNTDLPVISDSDWYTLYLSKGYYQEGESAARYLNGIEAFQKGGWVVQVVGASVEAETLATGFRQTWQELGQQPPVTVQLPPGKVPDRDFLQQLLPREKPVALLVWDDAGALPALELLQRPEERPEAIFLSGRYLAERIWNLPEPIRDAAYLTYPFAFSPYAARGGMGKQKVQGDLQKSLRQADTPLRDEALKIATLTNSLTQQFTSLLMELKGNYYRDTLLEVAGMMPVQQYPLYGRISFGTGQHYAARGCFIVQLSHGGNPELVKKSSWEIQ